MTGYGHEPPVPPYGSAERDPAVAAPTPPTMYVTDPTVDGVIVPEVGWHYVWFAPALYARMAEVPPGEPIHIQVVALADDRSWADIIATQRGGGQWQKRQPLGSVVLVPTDLDVDAFLAGGR